MSTESETQKNQFLDAILATQLADIGFTLETSSSYEGEVEVLSSFAHWWRYGWIDAAHRYANPGWYDRKYVPNKWEKDLPNIKRLVAKFSFEQVQHQIPPHISIDGARSALLTIVPSLPDVQIAETIMNNRIGEAIWFGFKPHEELFQRVFWNSFRYLKPHSEASKVLPSLFY